ncbi:MAG: arylsulfatase [Pseudomonadales bacterium]|nr:arylsulfatase [Pseudomonadales bacterium]
MAGLAPACRAKPGLSYAVKTISRKNLFQLLLSAVVEKNLVAKFLVANILVAYAVVVKAEGAQAEGVQTAENVTVEAIADTRPNVILILADDLGFSDIAPYGSEVNTPTLSALAEQGVSFTNYHTSAICSPSRAMLMTGVNNHRAGVATIPEMTLTEYSNNPNYRGTLSPNVVTVATLLEASGYHTYMAGKWHLGHEERNLPSRRGFQRTLALLDSGADNWDQKSYIPIYEQANWVADGVEYKVPDDFYSSRSLVDKTIEFIDSNHADGQPFFAYLPFQAVHIPVQAPREFIDRYMGVYDAGWHAVREARLARAVSLGIVPADTAMVTMPTTMDWDAQDESLKRFQSKRMAVYAGMIEAMDYHLGRLLEYLKATGQYDNTVFIFTSDNGPENSGPHDPTGWLTSRSVASLGYNNDYETLGLKDSYNAINASFASAAASPLAYFKFYTGEGGMRVPLLIAGAPLSIEPGLTHAFSWVTDITPTIMALAGVEQPGKRYAGRPVEPITGRNLLPLLRGEVDRAYQPDDAVGYELSGHSALFQGDYKLVRNRPPVGDGQWYLYNIVTDPGETRDLSQRAPERFQRMLSAYETFVRENGVLPVPANYTHIRQLVINTLHKQLGSNLVLLLLTGLVLLPFYVAYRVKFKS